MLSVPCCMLRRSPEYKVSANKYSQTAIGSLKRRSVQSEEAASGRNAALSLSQSHVVRYGSRYSKKFAATWFGHGRDSGCSLTLSHWNISVPDPNQYLRPPFRLKVSDYVLNSYIKNIDYYQSFITKTLRKISCGSVFFSYLYIFWFMCICLVYTN